MFLVFVWISIFFTCFTFDSFIFTIILSVVFHILTKNSKTTTLSAWFEKKFTRGQMLHSFWIRVTLFTMFISTFEFHDVQAVHHISMNFFKFNFFITFAFLWAWLVSDSPWTDAFTTEKALAASTLSWFLDYKSTNSTCKEVSFVNLFWILFIKLSDVQMSMISLFGFIIWFWNIL